MLFVESLLRWLAILRTLLRRAVTGEVAVMDRYAFCQYASLRARGARPSAERRARLAYRLFPQPDVTLFLDVDPALAHDRIKSRGYDSETMEYLDAAAAAYRGLPEFGSFVVVDAKGTADEVTARIRAALAARPAPVHGSHVVRTAVLAGGPLRAAAAALFYQLTEAL
jgi:dTMP kinase